MAKRRYVKTVNELRHYITKDNGEPVSSRQVATLLDKWGIKKNARGYDLAKIEECRAADKEKQKAGDGGLKDQKLQVEIEILEIKRDELLGKVIDRDRHAAIISEHTSLVRQTLDNFRKEIEAVLRDTEMAGKWDSIKAKMLATMRKAVQ